MNREKGIIYVLDTVEDVQASLQYCCTNVSLRESSSWGWECQVLAKPQWEISAYLIHPLFELLFLKWTGIYSRHFRWLWLCINIGWIREISGRVLKKKSEAHSAGRNYFSYLNSGQWLFFVVSFLGPGVQICFSEWFVVVRHACWISVFLLLYYSGMQRDSICLTSSATTSTCWRKTILASDMWIQTSSG